MPSSALSKACQYALTLWKKLTRFLEYPELELSNNLAENSMRPVALGRKNWIHIGSPPGGTKGRGDSLGRGKLPSAEDLCARLHGCDPSRPSRCQDPTATSANSLCLGHCCLNRTGFDSDLLVREAQENMPWEMPDKRFFLVRSRSFSGALGLYTFRSGVRLLSTKDSSL